jgi:predicted Fe-S protein YdhL (DUF1289 family)
MAGILVCKLGAAIDGWRERAPALDGVTPANPVAALAEVCAQPMPRARAAWLAWHAQTLDSPGIAICSTAQGDAVGEGCGRSDDALRSWTRFSPAEERAVWRRIGTERGAGRSDRYAERAGKAL